MRVISRTLALVSAREELESSASDIVELWKEEEQAPLQIAKSSAVFLRCSSSPSSSRSSGIPPANLTSSQLPPGAIPTAGPYFLSRPELRSLHRGCGGVNRLRRVAATTKQCVRAVVKRRKLLYKEPGLPLRKAGLDARAAYARVISPEQSASEQERQKERVRSGKKS